MKDKKKQRQRVIPHCYRRNQSRTLSTSCLSVSQLVQLGSYKKRINDLSRNNRHLAAALQGSRLEVAVQHNMLKDYAKDCNNILFARLKLNEMAKNVEKFVTDLEEVRNYLNFDLPSDNPFKPKRGSPSERIIKQPAINCIEEVSYESSLNEVVAPENVPASSDLQPIRGSGDKVSDVLPSNPVNDVNEHMEIAPILFADDSEGKKSSTKSKISKKVTDPELSLTPELNIDLTSVKLKRKSSRRHTQFLFPGSRSTSKGKTSNEKEKTFEELMTPAKPASPSLNRQQQDTPEIKQTIVKIFKSPVNNDIKEKESKSPNRFPENHLKVAHDTHKCDPSNLPTANLEKNSKTDVIIETQPVESNQTVHFCEDMELTDVIRPVHQIIVANGLPFCAKPLENTNFVSDTTKENDVPGFREEIKNKNMNKEVISERDTQQLVTIQPHALKQVNDDDDDDDIQIPKISENDEVQNVGMITFCEPNAENVVSRATKFSIRGSHRAKSVQYAVFFSSDESDDDSSFEISPKKTKISKRNTVIRAKSSKPSEKTGDSISRNKVFTETENKGEKNDLLECPIDDLLPQKNEKKLEKKSTKKLKDIKISKSKDDKKISRSKDDVPKKCPLASKDSNFKVNETENDLTKHSSDKSISKDANIKLNEEVNVKKAKPSRENDLPKHSSDKSSTSSKHKNLKLNENVNTKKLGINHENDLPKHMSHKSSTKSKDTHIKLDENVTVTKFAPSHENLKYPIFSPISSPSILKKTQSNFQKTKEIASGMPLNRDMFSDSLDDTITSVIESPKSESRKVSFAPADLVCKFGEMSVSKKIAENKKVRRTSKSVVDFEEFLEQETQSIASCASADNFSESTNGKQKTDSPVNLDFSGNTELYTFLAPSNNNFLIAPTTDDLLPRYYLNASEKSVKKSSKTSKNVRPSSKVLKSTDKLSLKKRKNHPKNTELISDEIFKEKNVLPFESPVSVSKPPKRKSLFKGQLDDDSKENVNHQIQDKTENVLQETDKTVTTANTELSVKNNILKKSTSRKNPRKTQGKVSMKKLSDNHKKLEPTPEIKKKKPSVALKSLENSPILKDTVNLPEVPDRMIFKRRSKPVCFKEPSMKKKLRRE